MTRQPVLDEFDHPGGESADEQSREQDRDDDQSGVEQELEWEAGELFHTCIVNDPVLELDEVPGRLRGGVNPTMPVTPRRGSARERLQVLDRCIEDGVVAGHEIDAVHGDREVGHHTATFDDGAVGEDWLLNGEDHE